MHGCAYAGHMYRKHALCAPCTIRPAVELISCCQVLRFAAMECYKRVGNPLWFCMSILLPSVFLLSLWRPQNGRCAARLSTSLPLLCPLVPSVSLSFPPVGHEKALLLSRLPILAFLLLLSAGEIHIQSQSSDPQKGFCISDNIREQIRQSIRGLAKHGWSKVLGVIYMGKKMTRRAGRLGVWGEREGDEKSQCSMYAFTWLSCCCWSLVIKLQRFPSEWHC